MGCIHVYCIHVYCIHVCVRHVNTVLRTVCVCVSMGCIHVLCVCVSMGCIHVSHLLRTVCVSITMASTNVPPLCTPICSTSLYTREVKHVYIYREVECMDMSYALCVYVYQWDVFHLSIHPYIPLVYREVKHVYIYREAECMGIPASFLCTPIYSTSLYTHIFH